MKEFLISIVIPLYNAETTIVKTLESLAVQTFPFDELIVVNDNSNDKSVKLVTDFLVNTQINFKIINHNKSRGLSESYNSGIRESYGDLVVTLHADIILKENALEKLIEPFLENENVVASYHVVEHPFEIWQTYNFWQKCLFSRLVGKKFSGLDGKFDCFKKNTLEEVGLFDGKTFFRAGEDGDIVFKLRKRGKVIGTEATIIHLHSIDPKFSPEQFIYKQLQYSEAQGVLLRRYGVLISVRESIKTYFRELLVVSLFLPGIQFFSILGIIIYIFVYNKELYLREWRNVRIVLLPFLNIVILFASVFYSIRGFISGKQRL